MCVQKTMHAVFFIYLYTYIYILCAELLRQANAEADAIRHKAEADIAREKKKAVDDAKSEIAGLAVDIAGKVVERSLDGQEHAALVDRFIDQLGDGV